MTFDELPESLIPGAEHRFYSAGGVCGFLQITPAQLRVLMTEPEYGGPVPFTTMMDGVPYFDGRAFEQICQKAAAVRNEIEQVQQSAANN